MVACVTAFARVVALSARVFVDGTTVFPSDLQRGKLLVLLRFEQLSIYIIVSGTSANAGGDADR